jgi:predicted transcriptional regulator
MMRNPTENKVLILEAIRAYDTNSIRGGATTLNIMYETFLSYDQARHYLFELLQGRMIESDVGTKRYRVTGKGIQYLSVYYDLDDLVINSTDRIEKGQE